MDWMLGEDDGTRAAQAKSESLMQRSTLLPRVSVESSPAGNATPAQPRQHLVGESSPSMTHLDDSISEATNNEGSVADPDEQDQNNGRTRSGSLDLRDALRTEVNACLRLLSK